MNKRQRKKHQAKENQPLKKETVSAALRSRPGAGTAEPTEPPLPMTTLTDEEQQREQEIWGQKPDSEDQPVLAASSASPFSISTSAPPPPAAKEITAPIQLPSAPLPPPVKSPPPSMAQMPTRALPVPVATSAVAAVSTSTPKTSSVPLKQDKTVRIRFKGPPGAGVTQPRQTPAPLAAAQPASVAPPPPSMAPIPHAVTPPKKQPARTPPPPDDPDEDILVIEADDAEPSDKQIKQILRIADEYLKEWKDDSLAGNYERDRLVIWNINATKDGITFPLLTQYEGTRTQSQFSFHKGKKAVDGKVRISSDNADQALQLAFRIAAASITKKLAIRTSDVHFQTRLLAIADHDGISIKQLTDANGKAVKLKTIRASAEYQRMRDNLDNGIPTTAEPATSPRKPMSLKTHANTVAAPKAA